MNEIVKITNLSKSYGEQNAKVDALVDLNLTIEAESFNAVIGRSGSGKTTLLNIIGGLEKPTKGTVELGGVNPYMLKDSKRAELRRKQIGYVFQFFNLLPELTAYENICLSSYLDHRHPDSVFLNTIIEKLELTELLEKYPAQLSGGQQQRVAVARALSCRPQIILADEPTGNLDKKSGEELMKLLRASCRMFRQTLLLVTHDLDIAREADRIITLEDGRIASDVRGNAYEG